MKKSRKYRVWNKHLLLSWYKLWVRKDEFHRSLDLDGRALEVMTKKERQIYCKDLVKRREIAHYKDLKTELDQLLQKN